ncbi:D-lactate dehydrogenase [cytochrome] [Talaromyces pinophilus]|nr:D-lactate dehydrogenase [cytochrome] [Talaromyces pinophilus]
MEKAIQEIQRILGQDSISTDDEDLKLHGYSEWSSINIDQLPVAVAYPKSTEEVASIAKVCYKYKVPMIPFSGGSSVEGHFSACFGGVSVDFMNMDKIVEFHPEDGTNAVRYGTMKDWVVNLTVVLADGRIIKTRKRPRKSSAGYNLNALFTGSEGTLGFVTEATLKLAHIPEKTGVAVTTFPTMRDAANAAVQVVHQGIPVGAVELLDDVQMDVINRMGGMDRKWKVLPTLFFKFSGTGEGIKDNIESVRRIVRSTKGSDFEVEVDEEKQKVLWSARKEALWSMLALRESGSEVWSTDVAVPLSRVADLVEVSKDDLNKIQLFGSMIGHIGDGNFHETILFDGTKEREVVAKCVHDMVHRALDMEGTCTGEHGVGLGKKEFLVAEVGEGSLQVMKTIKEALDPRWLMNPGKIFDP